MKWPYRRQVERPSFEPADLTGPDVAASAWWPGWPGTDAGECDKSRHTCEDPKANARRRNVPVEGSDAPPCCSWTAPSSFANDSSPTRQGSKFLAYSVGTSFQRE